MLKAILGKLSLITLATAFVANFSSTDVMAGKSCKKECAESGNKKACMKECKSKHGHKGKRHKKHQQDEAKQD